MHTVNKTEGSGSWTTYANITRCWRSQIVSEFNEILAEIVITIIYVRMHVKAYIFVITVSPLYFFSSHQFIANYMYSDLLLCRYSWLWRISQCCEKKSMSINVPSSFWVIAYITFMCHLSLFRKLWWTSGSLMTQSIAANIPTPSAMSPPHWLYTLVQCHSLIDYPYSFSVTSQLNIYTPSVTPTHWIYIHSSSNVTRPWNIYTPSAMSPAHGISTLLQQCHPPMKYLHSFRNVTRPWNIYTPSAMSLAHWLDTLLMCQPPIE